MAIKTEVERHHFRNEKLIWRSRNYRKDGKGNRMTESNVPK